MKINSIIITMGIIFLFVGALVYADSNGVWLNSEDLRGGIFGFDEYSFNYTFLNPVNISGNLSFDSFEIFKLPINDNHVISLEYVNVALENILTCGEEGLIYNGSKCIYVAGANLSVNSFIFNSANGAEFDTFVVSNSVTISGMVNSLILELKNNDTYASLIKNDVDTGLQRVLVSNGDVIKIRMKSLNDFELTSRVDVVLGNYETNWDVRTKSDELFIEEVDY